MPDGKYDLVPVQAQANQIAISSLQQQGQAETFLKRLVRLKKEITNHYKNLIDPIQTALNAKKDECKQHVEKLDYAIKDVKQKLSIYIEHENQNKALEAAALSAKSEDAAKKDREKEIKKLIKKGDVDNALSLKDQPLPTVVYHAEQTDTGDGISLAKTLKWEVEDESKIAFKYWHPRVLNNALIRSELYKGLNIAGVKSWWESSIRVSA